MVRTIIMIHDIEYLKQEELQKLVDVLCEQNVNFEILKREDKFDKPVTVGSVLFDEWIKEQ